MDLNLELISIGKYLKSMNSPCHYDDFFRVFKARHPDKADLWVKKAMDRRLRKLREQGIFFTPPKMHGQFFLAGNLTENMHD